MLLGCLLELTACVPAVAIALLSGSMLLMTDMLDYGRGIFTTFVGWTILRSIRTGRVRGFDYGTEKLQTLGGMLGSFVYLSALLFMTGWTLTRLIEPVALTLDFILLGMLFQFGDFVICAWLWRRTKRLAVLDFSPVMEMQWRVYRADTLSALAVVLGLALTLLLSRQAWSVHIDSILALVFVAYAGLSFLPHLTNGLDDLLDKTLREDLQLRIDRHLARQFGGYSSFHGVRSRRAGGKIFIDIALGFRPDQTVGEVERVVEQLREGIARDIPGSEPRVILVPGER